MWMFTQRTPFVEEVSQVGLEGLVMPVEGGGTIGRPV